MNTQAQIAAAKPAVAKQKKAVANSFVSLIRLVSDESITRCMNRLVAEENYELAVLYRDELVRRRAAK